MPSPVSVINFEFIRNILRHVQVVRADELGDVMPLRAEDGQLVQILAVPMSQVTGVELATARWNEQFHRTAWWAGDHADKLPWYML